MKGLNLGFILIIAILPLGTIDTPIAFGEIIDSPRKQMADGIEAEDVVCKVGLTLMIRSSGTAACVKPSSVDKLVSMEWGTIIEGYQIITEEMMEEKEKVEEKVEEKSGTLDLSLSSATKSNSKP